MQRWRLPFLGINEIPAWLTEFEIEQFFRPVPSTSCSRLFGGCHFQLIVSSMTS
jgi:hypothetical protein